MYVMMRALKTFLEVMIASAIVNAVYQPFDKRIILIIAIGSAIISLTVNSFFGIPENCDDGILFIDDSGKDKTRWTFSLERDPEIIAQKRSIHLKVKEFKGKFYANLDEEQK